MKKILHIPNYYPPHTGGIEDVCFNIVRLLQKSPDYEQYVICFNDVKESKKEVYDGVEVVRAGVWKKIASQSISFAYKRELKRILKQYRPDVVHFHAPNPFVNWLLLSLLPKDVKLIVHWHSDIVAQVFAYRFVKPIETRLLKRADTIIATSPNYVDFSKPLQKFKDKIIVIQNIIDTSKFIISEQQLKKIEEIKLHYQNLPIILFVGRHVLYKGLTCLIEASKKISNKCAVVIGGKGPLTEELKEAAKDLKHVHFVGRIPDEDLVAYYYAAQIFAFPSITKNEAFGVALAEAMYCQTPAITFTIDGSGVNWVNLNGTTGIEVANSDVTGLSMAIDTLLANKEMQEQMAINAKRRVEELFVPEKIEEKIKRLYE